MTLNINNFLMIWKAYKIQSGKKTSK